VQYLIDTVVRNRIYDSTYWKEHCFALTGAQLPSIALPVPDSILAASLIDKALDIRAVGGVYGGNQTPSEFLCLLLKLLQIQPEKEILLEYLQADEFKSVDTHMPRPQAHFLIFFQIPSRLGRNVRTNDISCGRSVRNPGTPAQGLQKATTSEHESVHVDFIEPSSLP